MNLLQTLDKALVVHDLRLHPAASELRPLFGAVQAHSTLDIPLRLRGENFGLMCFAQTGQRRNWSRDDVLFASHLATLVEHLVSDAQHLEIQEALERTNRELEQRVSERTAELREALRGLEENSLTDPLTGLRNRRFLMQHLDKDTTLNKRHVASAEAAIDATTIVLFMVDLDHFKHVNDTYGHLAGDAVLVQIKDRLQRVFRESDYLVRWGGEEFLIVARDTLASHAPQLAERVRASIGDDDFILPDGTRIAKTCSVGFASHPFGPPEPELLTWQDVTGLIDMALYAAKRAGRNGWVGLAATDKTDPGALLAAMKHSPRDAVYSGVVEMQTNLNPERVLNAF